MGMIKNDEPAERLFTQGMIIKGGAKMSKSLGNVVSPDDMVTRYGADSARVYTLFATSPDSELDWQDSGVEGVARFLARAYRFVPQDAARASRSQPYSPSDLSSEERKILRKLHQTIKKITDDFSGRWHFNTSIAALMEFLNECVAAESAFAGNGAPASFVTDVRRTFVLLLAPFAPYLAHELWETLGEKASLLRAPWPKYDPALAKEEEIEVPVQINGKLRSRVTVPADATEALVIERALADDKVKSAIAGKQIVKKIFVPGKLLNIVVK
jgi:leucyl-tRNA synthetase